MRDTWNVDAAHSSVIFSIRHLVIAKVRGRFSRFAGAIDLDEADFSMSKVSIEIDVASIDTCVEQRDVYLRSADFVDAERFPKATFLSKAIASNGEEHDVLGDLTLRGLTKEVTLKTTFHGRAKDPRGRERVAFGAKGSIDREAFGLQWNQVLEAGGMAVGPTAELEIEIEAIRA